MIPGLSHTVHAGVHFDVDVYWFPASIEAHSVFSIDDCLRQTVAGELASSFGHSVAEYQDCSFDSMFSQANSFIDSGNREGIDSYLIQMFCNFHIAMPVCIAFDGSH
jgi:hypothetical protein